MQLLARLALDRVEVHRHGTAPSIKVARRLCVATFPVGVGFCAVAKVCRAHGYVERVNLLSDFVSKYDIVV